MKKIIYILLINIFLLECKQEIKASDTFQTNDSLQIKNDTESATKFLKEFYFSVYGSDKNNEVLKKKYVSKRILERIDGLTSNPDDLILDYDPFIQGQDYNSRSIKETLKIVPLKNKNEFRVSFLLFDNKNEKKINIDYLLIKNKNGEFIINSILNDQYLNPKELSKTSNLYDKIESSEKTRKIISNNWNGKYSGSFLRLKDESADPRGWGEIKLEIFDKQAKLNIDSYVENTQKSIEVMSESVNKLILKDISTNKTLTITKNSNKILLEGNLMESIVGRSETYEIEKIKE